MATVEQIIVQLKMETKKSLKKLQGMNKTVKKSGEITKKAETEYKKLGQAQGRLGAITKQTTKQFAGWAMSMMFFGMAIQRAFKSILDAGVSTFQEIAHSIEGTVTPIDMLKAGMDGILFAIGDAISNYLEPFLPKIMEIIDKVGLWIQEHEDLAASIVLIGLALGTVMMIFGMGKLGVDGLVAAFHLLKVSAVKIFASGGVLGKGGLVVGAIKSVALFLGVSFGAAIAIIIAIIAVLVAMWVTNFGGIRDFFEDTFSAILAFFKSIWDNVKGVFESVWGFITSLLKGDWDEALKYLLKAVVHIVSLILKAFVLLGALIVNVFIFAWSLIVDLFKMQVKGLLSLIKLVAQGIDAVFGTNLASGIEYAMGLVDDVAAMIKVDYIGGEDVDPIFEGIDETLGLGEGGAIINITNNYDTGEGVVEDIERQSNTNSPG